MRFEDFAGQSALIASLKRDFQSGRVAHAYLLSGPAGTGKRTLAATCAQALFCRADGDKPCGTCAPCIRFLSGNHPDVYRVTSEKKSIGVEEIRSLVSSLGQKAFEGGHKAVLIDRADTMTPQAQNALLKTLEEPPGDTVFFLAAQTTSSLLPTIVSRTRHVALTPLALDEAAAVLERAGIPKERAALLAHVADGCVGEALRMEANPAWWELRQRTLEALGNVCRPGDVWAAAQKLRDEKDQAGAVLDLLSFAVRMALRAALGEPSTVSQEPFSAALAQELTPEALCRLLAQITRARKMLASNVAWQQVLETNLLSLAEEMNA